jgi:SNF2 family DNA or RNA helicase
VQEGWQVQAEGRVYRKPGEFALEISSGIDWFDVKGQLDFGPVVLPLPALLRAVRRRARFVPLGDGSLGMLPEEWLERWGLLAGAPARGKDHVRLSRAQAVLLEPLLSELVGSTWDADFEALRREIRGFSELAAEAAPRGLRTTLRPYQARGLAWLRLLGRVGLGGCLADDMGLGKTVQVLALLLERHQAARRRRRSRRPSLVVVPRSLVHNWIAESARFTPELCMLAHVGPERGTSRAALARHDVVVTSYGTLRRDIDALSDCEFDTVVLDEAQAIKNASSATARAVRRLRARHRLALSGTPIENHLGELWSLLDFLNPGLLDTAKSLRALATGGNGSGQRVREMIGQSLRPLLLRRTKRQVAPELPERTEQTIELDLEPAEARAYAELYRYYAARIQARVDEVGMDRSTPQILEALLRLRQAACHPGLLDPTRTGDRSAKVSLLVQQLVDLRDQGHKALVFSQFRSLLDIVREQLAAEGVDCETLDGRTRNRERHVARFQTDSRVTAFLISLKAGGTGLNLTAAEYVFILDPWWNPAAEAQAIDRTHRIGQTRRVLAYRLLARGTVEEKVAELQARKRELVEAVLGEDGAFAGKLTRDDLRHSLALSS